MANIDYGNKNTFQKLVDKIKSKLASVALSGKYSDLSGKPTSLPANGGTAQTISSTLPISKGGTGQTTASGALDAIVDGARTESANYSFSDNDSIVWVYSGNTGKEVFKTKFSKLWNYIKSKLATVATSGNYNDLSNKPSIPNVGNGTVTIRQAGASKGSFTMNQSGNTTIDLTDANTWRPVQDNLTSTSATDSLSAKQGKILREAVEDRLPLSSGGTVNGNIAVNGDIRANGNGRHIYVGNGVDIWSDSEGGNVRIEGGDTDQTAWEMDAYNGNLRIFTYANGVRSGIVIDKTGKVTFPNGTSVPWGDITGKPDTYAPSAHRHSWGALDNVPDIGGKMAQSYMYVGYNVDFGAYCFSYSIGDSRYVIKITGRIFALNSYSETFDWGINLSTILGNLKLNTGMNYQCGTFVVWQANGGILSNYLGFGPFLAQKSAGGYKVLTPCRYYTAEGNAGPWNNQSGLALDGNFWDATIVVA